MHSAERRRQINSIAAVQGRVTVAELADIFAVTAETIRRDLALLDQEGKLFRIHGGAVPARSFHTEITPFSDRAQASPAAKSAIAAEALNYLPPAGGTVFLDAGSTTANLARAIADTAAADDQQPEAPLTVITNSLVNALMLADTPHVNVHLLGGHIRPLSQAVVGDTALQALGLLHADVAFIGTNALTAEYGLSTPDGEEAAIKRAMIAYADQVVTLCDSTKFGFDYVVSFAQLADIDVVITDEHAPVTIRQELDVHGVEVRRARSSSAGRENSPSSR